MSRFAIAFALLQASTFVESRQLQSQGRYCDQWTPCFADEQCWNSHCYPLTCEANQNCGEGFECSQGKCYPLQQAENNGSYCDQWTSCGEKGQCIGNKCVPLNCQRDVNCPVGFVCWNKKCTNLSPVDSNFAYCDQWTACSSESQCVNKKCVPFKCQITPNCATDYVCYEGSCIQINPNHTRGRYCDQSNQCDILHKCVENQCVWK